MNSDESPWDEDPHFSKSNSSDTSTWEYLTLMTDYIGLFLAIIAIAADILLIIIILKYKRLKIRINFYLIHFAISHMIYIISTPFVYIIVDVFYNGYLEPHWNCVLIRAENFAMALVFTFIGGFGIDSFLEKVKPSWFSKYKERYIYVFLFFYFGHFLIYAIAGCICLKYGFENKFSFYFLSTYFFVVLLGILYITYEEQKMEKNFKLSTPHKAYALTISIIVLLMWAPLIFLDILMIIFDNLERVEFILWHMSFLPEYLADLCILTVVYKLWKSDKQFKTAFRKAFRRSVQASDYAELNTSENEERISKPL